MNRAMVDILVRLRPGVGLLQHAALVRELQELLGAPSGCSERQGAAPAYEGSCASRGDAPMRDDKEWLLDMLEAIENIDSVAAKGKEAFSARTR